MPSPATTPLIFGFPVEGYREIKFETIKRGMGIPSLLIEYPLRNKTFLWIINSDGRMIPLLEHLNSRDRWLIKNSINFDSEVLVIAFQGLTEGGWDHAIEIKRVWQENNIINIQTSYETLGPGPEIDSFSKLPKFHIDPFLPYHAIKVRLENIKGRDDISFRLLDASGKEIIRSTATTGLEPSDLHDLKPLEYEFVIPGIVGIDAWDYFRDYEKYRDPWLEIIINRSQVEGLPRKIFEPYTPRVGFKSYNEILTTDFDRYFLLIIFGGVNNDLKGWFNDPGIYAIWQDFNITESITVAINYFKRKGPPHPMEPSLNYIIVKIDKNSMIKRGNIRFNVGSPEERILQKYYNIP